jgi:hypothetical protein
MVAVTWGCAVFLAGMSASAALAQDAQTPLFPGSESCYAQGYGADHLARHPTQRVTQIALRPEGPTTGSERVLHVLLRLRDVPGGFGAYADCDIEAASSLACTMRKNAGGFRVSAAEAGAILVEVAQSGMRFENDTVMVRLEAATGADRSFMLRPVACW